MKIIRAPTSCRRKGDIFLAGSILSYKTEDELQRISLKENTWREYIIESVSDLEGTIFNPDRIYFPEIGSKEYFEQIRWEREYLRRSRLAIFWLSAKKPTSYASRVEVGFATALGIPIIIGIEKGFHGSTYLEAFTEITPVRTLEELSDKLREYLIKKKTKFRKGEDSESKYA